MANPTTQELASEWLRLDQDQTTRDEISKLLEVGNDAKLENRLRTRIAFGTAGLRAKMEAGFARMNSLTVIQASQGLAAYLLETLPHSRKQGVVIGRDARHNSKKFAKLAAAAFVAKGIKVWWYEVPTHTPLVPFGVNELGAAAGIMITASHNPAQDNGYKVYWSNGCQIIPPHDKGIAAAISQNLEPVSWDVSVTESSLLVEGSLGLVEESYYKAVRLASDPHHHLVHHPDHDLKYAYTAMHGVGLHFMTKALENLGILQYMSVVQEQVGLQHSLLQLRVNLLYRLIQIQTSRASNFQIQKRGVLWTWQFTAPIVMAYHSFSHQTPMRIASQWQRKSMVNGVSSRATSLVFYLHHTSWTHTPSHEKN